MTALVHNEGTAGGVGHREVRPGESGIGGVTAFKAGLPVVRSIHPAVPVARNRTEEPERFEQIGVARRVVCGYVHREQTKEMVAGGEPENAPARGIGGEVVLLRA